MSAIAAANDEDPERIRRLTHGSTQRETVLTKRVQYEIGAELYRRGIDFTFLEAGDDRDGYDIVIDVDHVTRHVQLKATVAGGKRRAVDINTRLAMRPSGCVVWLVVSEDLRTIERIRWFGGAPHERLPELGESPVRHSRANASGVKAIRPGHRTVSAARFETLLSMSELTDRLSGEAGK